IIIYRITIYIRNPMYSIIVLEGFCGLGWVWIWALVPRLVGSNVGRIVRRPPQEMSGTSDPRLRSTGRDLWRDRPVGITEVLQASAIRERASKEIRWLVLSWCYSWS